MLGRFASKAFRRPAPEATLSRLVALAEKTYSLPDTTFEKGIAQAIVAILSSPRFLFHLEGAESPLAGETFARIDEYSLAARLSFALLVFASGRRADAARRRRRTAKQLCRSGQTHACRP